MVATTAGFPGFRSPGMTGRDHLWEGGDSGASAAVACHLLFTISLALPFSHAFQVHEASGKGLECLLTLLGCPHCNPCKGLPHSMFAERSWGVPALMLCWVIHAAPLILSHPQATCSTCPTTT